MNATRRENVPKQKKAIKLRCLKKDTLDKERVSNWSANSYTIDDIKPVLGQKHYYITGRGYLRHEVFKVLKGLKVYNVSEDFLFYVCSMILMLLLLCALFCYMFDIYALICSCICLSHHQPINPPTHTHIPLARRGKRNVVNNQVPKPSPK